MVLTITSAPGQTGALYYMRGNKPSYLARNIDLGNTEAVQLLVSNASCDYPTQALKLDVYRKNGAINKLVETLDVSTPALAGDEPDEEMTNVAKRPAAYSPGVPPGLDAMTTFILAQAQSQLADKEGLILDLRDDKKRLDGQVREMERQIMQLQFDLAHKDKEQTYAIADAVASQPRGLAGVGEVVAQIPPGVLEMLATRFLGPAPAAAPAQLGSHLSDGQRQIVQYLTECASQSEEIAAKIYAIVSQGVNNAGGLDILIEHCKTTFPQFSRAA